MFFLFISIKFNDKLYLAEQGFKYFFPFNLIWLLNISLKWWELMANLSEILENQMRYEGDYSKSGLARVCL